MFEILTIGDELVSGSTIDTNSGFIARQLGAAGMTVTRVMSVGDGLDEIMVALMNGLSATRFMIVTGGLGPTEDDRTARAAAAAFGRRLALSDEALGLMQARFDRMGRPMNPANRKQALLPEGCRIIENPAGTACGFLVEDDGRTWFFLPGVPEEVRVMVDSFLIEYLRQASGLTEVIRHRTLKVFGLGESVIHEKLEGFLPRSDLVSLAFYPQYPEISLKIVGRGDDEQALLDDMERFRLVICERIGAYIYSDTGELLEETVGALLKDQGVTIAVAESCTGGLISHRLTNVSGSSVYVERAVVTYSNRAKVELLQVPEELINEKGAVCEEVARRMAEGVRRLSGSDYGIGVTGIAGPAGGTDAKPVGTVCISVAGPDCTEVKTHHIHGSRERVKLMSAQMALNMLRKMLLKEQ